MSAQKLNKHGLPDMKADVTAEAGSSQTTKIVQIINQALPWIVIPTCVAIAAFALGIAWSNQGRIDDINETVADLRANYATRFDQQREDFSWKIDELKKAADKSEREARMLEYYVIQTDEKLSKRGLLNQPDSWVSKREKK